MAFAAINFRPGSLSYYSYLVYEGRTLSVKAIVAVPTLNAGQPLERCLEALAAQTFENFTTVVIDNGRNELRELAERWSVELISNEDNVGFGAAINQAMEGADSPYVCALNDDARPAPTWLSALVEAVEASPRVGMCASRIMLQEDRLDSAGLGIYPDGTTKQVGHRGSPNEFLGSSDALLPSGCAALYRREMLDGVGAFDEDYFLYCEDADLGLRGRLAGWECRYVSGPVVQHDYSVSSGRASETKAFYVERNRLYTVVKTFPLGMWVLAPLYSVQRYWEHWRSAREGKGLAGEYSQGAVGLLGVLLSAHWSVLRAFPGLLKKRSQVRRFAKLGPGEFRELLKRYHLSAKEIAAQGAVCRIRQNDR